MISLNFLYIWLSK